MNIWHIIEDFLKNSSLHGARFIVDKDHNFFEKSFWAICVLLCWIGSAMLMSSSLDAFQNNAISFVVETTYLEWDTKFPSIVVCESKNMDIIQKAADGIWGIDHDFTLEEVLSELAYFRGESYHTILECGGGSDVILENCILSNFSYYANLVKVPCNKMLRLCKWNGNPFECCEYFQAMDTEMGICFALNSIQVRDKPKHFDMVSNMINGPGKFNMEILTDANVYAIGEEDVPSLVSPKSDILPVSPFISYTKSISIRNIENDPLTRDVSVEQRKCRFPDENNLNVHKYYSYSACSVQCRKDKQLEICNCTSHLIPNTDPRLHCNMTGLICLNEHYDDLSIVIPKWAHGRKGVVCDCLPSCTEIDISLISDFRENIYEHDPEIPFSKFEINLASLPTERYKRNVIRGKLDLVVSMGGTTGLFLGASLLSFVEIIYYFTIRPYNNISRNIIEK